MPAHRNAPEPFRSLTESAYAYVPPPQANPQKCFDVVKPITKVTQDIYQGFEHIYFSGRPKHLGNEGWLYLREGDTIFAGVPVSNVYTLESRISDVDGKDYGVGAVALIDRKQMESMNLRTSDIPFKGNRD